MCGIAGFFRHRDDALLKTMTDRLRHRGPDSEGYFSNDQVSPGMRRLAVLDVNGGDQPLFNENRRVAVVYNGEIYNFRELRDELTAKGHRFVSRTDTEILVHLYEEEGAELVKRLNGMFAFALWDDEKKQLLLARDPLGIKPLYYAETNGRLAFASEIKALQPFPDLSREISSEAIASYLTRGSIPAPWSIYRSIRKLPPAHRLIASAAGIRVERYWSLPRPDRDRSHGVDLAQIENLLDRAVSGQLISDVPLGVFLSGGLDSGSLAAIASRHSGAPLKTFTIGYAAPDEEYNELEPARRLARHFNCDHHETILTPNIRDLLAPLARSFDEPFADSSAVPTYLVSREARKHVTVALAGVGGDELFGGYPRYIGLLWAERTGRIPSALRNLGACLAGFFPDRGGHINWTGRAKRFLRDANRPLAEQYSRWTSILSPELIPPKYRMPIALENEMTPSDAALRDFSSYLPDDLLCLSDRMSMANSLEVRVPFLDLPLVEHMARVPLEEKLAGGQLKALLKKIIGPRLPPGHLRQPKRGFSIPLARWLREDLKDVLDDALNPQRVKERGYLDPEVVARLRRAHDLGQENNGDALWMMLMLELWHRENAAP